MTSGAPEATDPRPRSPRGAFVLAARIEFPAAINPHLPLVLIVGASERPIWLGRGRAVDVQIPLLFDPVATREAVVGLDLHAMDREHESLGELVGRLVVSAWEPVVAIPEFPPIVLTDQVTGEEFTHAGVEAAAAHAAALIRAPGYVKNRVRARVRGRSEAAATAAGERFTRRLRALLMNTDMDTSPGF